MDAIHGALRMAIFVDCLGTLAVLLGFYVLASTAQARGRESIFGT